MGWIRWSVAMRIALIAFTLIGGFMIGSSAIKQMSDIQTNRQNQLCQIDPSFCNDQQWLLPGNWPLLHHPLTLGNWIQQPTASTLRTSCLTRNGMLTRNGRTNPISSLIGSLEHSTPSSSDRTTQVIPLFQSPQFTLDERINLRSSHLWPLHSLLLPMRNVIRYWTNREPQRARLISVSTYEQAHQTVQDFMNLGWRAEIAPPHIQWNGTAPPWGGFLWCP